MSHFGPDYMGSLVVNPILVSVGMLSVYLRRCGERHSCGKRIANCMKMSFLRSVKRRISRKMEYLNKWIFKRMLNSGDTGNTRSDSVDY